MEVLAFLLLIYITIMIQGAIFKNKVFDSLDYNCQFSMNEANEGDEIFLVESMHNKKLLPIPWMKVEIQTSRWLDYAGTRSSVMQDRRYVSSNFVLRSYQKKIRRWYLKCTKRGIYRISNVILIAGDLLGVHTCCITMKTNTRLIVYPKTINLEEYFIPANYLQGNTIVKRWVVDDPFMTAGTREYTPRDPMNRIYWPATARAGQLMVRKNEFTSNLNMTIIINIQSLDTEFFDVVDKERIEIGIKAAATLLDRSLINGIPVRLAVNGGITENDSIADNMNTGGPVSCNITTGKTIFTGESAGREHVNELMKVLAGLELKKGEEFEDYLQDISDRVENSNVILITSYINEKILNELRSMKLFKNDITVISLNYIEPDNMPEDMDVFYYSGVEKENANKN